MPGLPRPEVISGTRDELSFGTQGVGIPAGEGSDLFHFHLVLGQRRFRFPCFRDLADVANSEQRLNPLVFCLVCSGDGARRGSYERYWQVVYQLQSRAGTWLIIPGEQ